MFTRKYRMLSVAAILMMGAIYQGLGGAMEKESRANPADAMITINVDGQNPAASDDNAEKDLDRPLRSVARAIDIATSMVLEGTPVRILIQPGRYHENGWLLDGEGRNQMFRDTPLIIEGARKEEVIITGSEVWVERWKESGGVFAHDWPYNMYQFRAWNENGPEGPLGWRREMVFLNGQWLRQVAKRADLVDGTYWVDEGLVDQPDGAIYVKPPKGVDFATAIKEISTGPDRTEVSWSDKHKDNIPAWPPVSFLSVNRKNNVTLRNLTFQHANMRLSAHAVEIRSAAHIVVEDSCFEWNNGSGLGLYDCEDAAVRRCIGNHNGASGFGLWKVRDLVWEDNESSYNNWRGDLGKYWRYAIAGVKFHELKGATIQRHIARYNLSDGVWFDLFCNGVTMEDCVSEDNLRFGVFYEVCGGIVFRHCALRRNMAGLCIKGSSDGVVEACDFENNASQVSVFPERRTFKDDPMILPDNIFNNNPRHWKIVDCRFKAGGHPEWTLQRERNSPEWVSKYETGTPQRFLTLSATKEQNDSFLRTVEFQNNKWEHALTGNAFPSPRPKKPDLTWEEFERYVASIKASPPLSKAPSPEEALAEQAANGFVLNASNPAIRWRFGQGKSGLAGWKVLSISSRQMTEGDAAFFRIEDKGQIHCRGLELGAEVKAIRVSALLRAHDLKPGEREYMTARVTWQFRDGAGKAIGPSPKELKLQKDCDWTELKSEETVPEGARAIDLMAGLWKCSGTFDIDEISIEVLQLADMEQ